MDIALCHQGENYSGVLVAIRSAVANCSDPQRLDFHVHSDLNDQSRNYIISQSGANVNFYPLNLSYFESIKFSYPPGYYYRILLPLLHPSIEHMVYIDTDIIVERDLLTLEEYSHELNSVVGFGILDNMDETFKYALKIPFYVNTGFLYLNLDRCRLINFTQRVLERCDLNLYPDAGHDQIAINQLYSGSEIWARLDQTWNIQTPIPEALTLVPRGGEDIAYLWPV
jgi:lipopolysaccharide biosynthesis glycosyltransferase